MMLFSKAHSGSLANIVFFGKIINATRKRCQCFSVGFAPPMVNSSDTSTPRPSVDRLLKH
jgi:hypothetical protein